MPGPDGGAHRLGGERVAQLAGLEEPERRPLERVVPVARPVLAGDPFDQPRDVVIAVLVPTAPVLPRRLQQPPDGRPVQSVIAVAAVKQFVGLPPTTDGGTRT